MEGFVLALLVVAVIFLMMGIRVVRQGYVYTIERFGRFPHRNAILGRTSTPEEAEFLRQPGSGF